MKKDFRKNAINLRKQQTPDFISKNSNIITEKLLTLDSIKNANNIMLYLDFNNEVQTDELVKKLITLRKIVSSPVTIMENRQLIPYKILDLDKSIHIGTYGIREPKKEVCSKVDIKDIDVVIVPAVAYDINCYRLGYGGGFYDRFLSNLRPDTISIGISFDLQVFDSIPKEPHDAQLNYVITESRILASKL